MRRFLSSLFSLAIVLAVCAAGALYYGKGRFEAAGPHRDAVEVTLPRGAGLNRIAKTLEASGVVSDELIFRLGARAKQAERRLKAGEYLIPAGASMAQVLAQLEEGETLKRRVTFAEGLSSVEIVDILRAEPLLEGPVDVPAEGSLAPNTYFFERGASRVAILEQMQAAQSQALDELWEGRAPDLPLKTKEEALVLASIVEKETGIADERARVAAVFVNRLRRGMRLQSDPTVVYGITLGAGPLGRGLRRSELDRTTPFNTYKINGLPPSPIANPGREAIAATLNPADTDEYYFVADGTGGHVFSKTLAEHNRNVRKWRKIEKERAAQ